MVNIDEELIFRDEYFNLSKELFMRIMNNEISPNKKIVIAIGGESGCGKSTTAFCLEREFNRNGIHCATLHMDSYFILPPKENHLNRLKSLENVGPHEVNMSMLNEHITAFKSQQNQIKIPIVNYKENCFGERDLNIAELDILIVEGVYSFLLRDINHKVFLSRTYHETFQNRRNRTREDYDPLVEEVLEIEHKIVSPLIDQADFVIMKNYTIK